MNRPKYGAMRVVRQGDVFVVEKFHDGLLGLRCLACWCGPNIWVEMPAFPTADAAVDWIKGIDHPDVVWATD